MQISSSAADTKDVPLQAQWFAVLTVVCAGGDSWKKRASCLPTGTRSCTATNGWKAAWYNNWLRLRAQ